MNFITKLKKYIFSSKKVIYITDFGVKEKKFTFFNSILKNLIFILLFFFSFQYFYVITKLSIKDIEIKNLKNDKLKIISQLNVLKKDIEKINNFFVFISKYDRLSSIDFSSFKKNDNLNDFQLSDTSKFIVKKTNSYIKDVNLLLVDKILNINNAKQNIDFNSNIRPVSYEEEYKLYDDKYSNIDETEKESLVLSNVIEKNTKILENLEEKINTIPFSQPIDVIKITSKFGERIDPIFKKEKVHEGVDLVGSYKANVFATAPGEVIFSGIKNGYGNTIIIKHKNDFKTLYAHLDKINVKIGSKVKRGDSIGIQGSTGKSTGDHLHYEILKNDKNYDPQKFLNVGKKYLF